VKLALGAAIGVAALIAALGAEGSTARAPFEPRSLTAVSATTFWLSGNGALLHSSDGGRHFDRLPKAPAAEIRFADSRDGFSFGGGSPLFATHDGGRTWHRTGFRNVLAFATAGGTAYAVTCRRFKDGDCRVARFERSPVSHDAWRLTPMPFPHAEPNFDLAAHGAGVWLFGAIGNAPPSSRNVLARSTDHGRSFAIARVPCYAELAAELDPVSTHVVWAFCPTGMMGVAWRSRDGGATFQELQIPLTNGASLAAVSETTAVVARNVGGFGLLRTTDGGRTWHHARAPANGNYQLTFVDSRAGFALVLGTSNTQLWKTTDAGSSWQRVPIG
jgi:photosystem II stability/assembly factor-like uncharacterized protein